MKFAILVACAMIGAGVGYGVTQTQYANLATVLGFMFLFAALADWATRGLEYDEDWENW